MPHAHQRPPRPPSLDQLLPPLDGSPLRRREIAEVRAVRLALVTVVAILHAWDFSSGDRPIPDGEEMSWLRDRLEPLAAASPTIRRLRRLLDDRAYARAWFDPDAARRNFRQMSLSARRLGRQPPPALPLPSVRNRKRYVS